jgi:RND superfamily putative drug exporter
MALLGRANWWLPGWLDRILPHLDVHGDAAGKTFPAPGAAGAPGTQIPAPATGARQDEEAMVP